MQEEIDESLLYRGDTLEFMQPSGRIIRIREHNGDDEALMSKTSSEVNSGKNILQYLAAVCEWDSELKRRPTVEDIMSWGIKDKYYTLFVSRVHSVGPEMKFKRFCPNPGCKVDGKNPTENTWTVDLEEFKQNLSTYSHNDLKGKSSRIVTPYAKGLTKTIEFTLSSGRAVRYNILDSIGETALLDIPENERTRNSNLTVRNLEIHFNGKWVKVFKFNVFKSQDLREIEANVDENDEPFVPLEILTCPKCNYQDPVVLTMLNDFFYQALI